MCRHGGRPALAAMRRALLVLACATLCLANVTLPLNVPYNVSLAAGGSVSVANSGKVATITALAAALNASEVTWTNASAGCADSSHVETNLRIRSTTADPLPAYQLLVDLSALPYRTSDRDLVMCRSGVWTTVFSICRADESVVDTGSYTWGVQQRVCAGIEFASQLRWGARLDCPTGRWSCDCSKTDRFVDEANFRTPWILGALLFSFGAFLVNTQACLWQPRISEPGRWAACLCSPGLCSRNTSTSYRVGLAMCLLGVAFLLPAYAFGLPASARRPGSYLECSSSFGGVCFVLGLAGLLAWYALRRGRDPFRPFAEAPPLPLKADGNERIPRASGSHSLFDAWRRALLMLIWSLLLIVPASNSQNADEGYFFIYLLGFPGVVLGVYVFWRHMTDCLCIVVCCCHCCAKDGHRMKKVPEEDKADRANKCTIVTHFLLSSIQLAVMASLLVFLGSWPCYDRYMPSRC